MAKTMAPAEEVLPDVLPTERLLASGIARPHIRAELRRIANCRNALTVGSALLQSFGVIAAAVLIDERWAWILAFVLAARGINLLGVLAHEATHRLLFTSRRWNDWVGRWLLGYVSMFPFDSYRRAHLAHHKDEFGPKEPDGNIYNGYPITRDSLRRKLTRDLFFISGWKNVKILFRGLANPAERSEVCRLLAVQVAVFGAFWFTGRPELYAFLWVMPWLTLWRVITRLRMIAEHAGLTRSADRRLTTHLVHQSWWARFWIVPYNLGWHLAHHVDMGVPFRMLPDFHAELAAAGWISPSLEYSSYIALWRQLASAEA